MHTQKKPEPPQALSADGGPEKSKPNVYYIAVRISDSERFVSVVRVAGRTVLLGAVVPLSRLPPSRVTVSVNSRSAGLAACRVWRAAALRDSPPSRPIAAMWARSRLTVTPPLRPAWRASSDDHSCAVPFSWAALPPRLAISFCRAGSIDAKPRLLFPVITPPAVRKFEKVHAAAMDVLSKLHAPAVTSPVTAVEKSHWAASVLHTQFPELTTANMGPLRLYSAHVAHCPVPRNLCRLPDHRPRCQRTCNSPRRRDPTL